VTNWHATAIDVDRSVEALMRGARAGRRGRLVGISGYDAAPDARASTET
jgi:hypothetical protein